MHARAALGWTLAVTMATGAGCTAPSTKPPSPATPVTPATHSWFPIVAGTNHEVGKAAQDGVIACEACHPSTADTFKNFTCLGCHEHDQSCTDRLHTSEPNYAYGPQACYACHPQGERMAYDHAGITGACAQCHDVAAPYAALPLAGFTHPDRSGSDCGACHVTTSWKGAQLAPLNSRDPLQDVMVNELIPTYRGTSITSLSPQTEALPQFMNHASTQLPAGAMSACANCHQGAEPGNSPVFYYPGLLHSSLANLMLAQPTGCTDCHAASQPAGLVGPTGAGRTPPSGEMKHDAVAWANDVPGSVRLVAQDCGVCHAPPSATLDAKWTMGVTGNAAVFHSAISAQPTSCLDCHANSRPAVAVNVATPIGTVTFDHAAGAMGECTACHVAAATSAVWTGGKFHLPGSATPASCQSCHAGERPTSTAGWTGNFTAAPFDAVTNSAGITHGAGQDCVVCHAGPGTGGAWGGAQSWRGGTFSHAASGLAGTTCLNCHTTQRPDLVLGSAATAATLVGFDHALNGTGDCYGCHQATVVAGTYSHYYNTGTGQLPNGDWKDGTSYPGSTLVGSAGHFVNVTQITLIKNGTGLVTGTTSATATLNNAMLHISSALPAQLNAGPTGAPDNSKCWHCHTNTGGTVTAFSGGLLHDSFTNYAATPGGTVTPLPPPTHCLDCHAQMRPADIVEKAGTTTLQPMDHHAAFSGTVTIGGQSVTAVTGLDCKACHASPGDTWTDGAFHSKLGAAAPADCVTCHYPLMADAAKSDLTSGQRYAMAHRSPLLTLQACQTCHPTALSKGANTPIAAALWQTGVLHASLATQPAQCGACHAVTDPTASTQSTVSYALPLGGTSSNGGQWMNHQVTAVVGKDCALCHLGDAKPSGAAWSRSVSLHSALTGLTTCDGCHGLTNGNGSVAGTNNNLPLGLTDSSQVTTASSSPSGTHDQLTHTDLNVSSHACNFCHTQVGASTATGVQGKEWAQAKFHPGFTGANPLVMNTTTGRCSHCHLNVKPGVGYLAQDHSAFTDVSGTQDCSSCHSYPGTGTATAANWLGAAGQPQYISVGGFTVPSPPAANTTTVVQGIANLPHPTVAATTACTTCHATAAGGRQATGYDHASTLIATNCKSCHEVGSDLVGTGWNGSTTTSGGAGDTRPWSIVGLVPSFKGNTRPLSNGYNHFFAVDCKECHTFPSGTVHLTTGTAYKTAWKFSHTESKMTRSATCNLCHGSPNNLPD